MLPWSVGGVTDLPPDAKLSEMQQNADWCNSLGPPRQMFLTKPQCHNRANSYSSALSIPNTQCRFMLSLLTFNVSTYTPSTERFWSLGLLGLFSGLPQASQMLGVQASILALGFAWLCAVNGLQVAFGDREATTASMPMTDIMQFLAFSNKADMVTGPSATGLAGTWDVPYCIGAPMIITPQGDGSYWENGKTYVLRFAAAQMGLLVAAYKVCCFIMEQKMRTWCLSLCRLAVDTKLPCIVLDRCWAIRQCVPYTTRARHCNIVGGLSKCHSFFQ